MTYLLKSILKVKKIMKKRFEPKDKKRYHNLYKVWALYVFYFYDM